MDPSLKAIETALRILGAITEHNEPNSADVEELKRFSPFAPEDTPIDEIACEVVAQALKARAAARGEE
jgi:hypothetical protein